MIEPVLLVGLGVVGRAIAAAHLGAGVPIRIADQDASTVEAVAGQSLRDGSASRRVGQVAILGMPSTLLLPPTSGLSDDLGGDDVTCGLMIESIAERLDVKQAFHADAQSRLDPATVLCSNTSTLPIAAIGRRLGDPSRLVGMHFFMPVRSRRGVEIIAASATGRDVVDAATRHAVGLGKEPFCVGDGPGFVVNRLLTPYLNESLNLLCSGVDHRLIAAAAEAVGMPMSPLELIDLIGLRTAFDGGRSYWQAFPKRIDPSPLLPALIKQGRLGQQVAAGFYDYDPSAGRSVDLAIATRGLVERYRRPLPQSGRLGDDPRSIASRLWTVVDEEAALILRDGIAADRSVIDTALAGGLGWCPPRCKT